MIGVGAGDDGRAFPIVVDTFRLCCCDATSEIYLIGRRRRSDLVRNGAERFANDARMTSELLVNLWPASRFGERHRRATQIGRRFGTDEWPAGRPADCMKYNQFLPNLGQRMQRRAVRMNYFT